MASDFLLKKYKAYLIRVSFQTSIQIGGPRVKNLPCSTRVFSLVGETPALLIDFFLLIDSSGICSLAIITRVHISSDV